MTYASHVGMEGSSSLSGKVSIKSIVPSLLSLSLTGSVSLPFELRSKEKRVPHELLV